MKRLGCGRDAAGKERMKTEKPYRDRHEAGRILAAHLRGRLPVGEAVVLGLPRGGVPVAFEVAQAIHAPLEACVVRKLGVPDQPELAMGAIAAGGYEVLNQALIDQIGITPLQIAAVADRETNELTRRETRYCGERPRANLRGRVAILVDDGLATGFTMRAAVASVRGENAAHVVVAVPVGASETCRELAPEVDAVICPLCPEPFHAVGEWYRDFRPVTDAEVDECLAAASHLGQVPGESLRRHEHVSA
jgi:putative phosphoribosyl transferase